jgi:hypothetical protein
MADGFPEPADVPVRKTLDPDLSVQEQILQTPFGLILKNYIKKLYLKTSLDYYL